VERFDAIVVGAGPGGSVTAYRLARAGVRVLLLDRARFPRDKPCGGGITLRARNQLPIDPAPVVEDVVDTFELGLRYGRRIERRGRGPLVLMTQRRRLDHHLANAAAAAGADFRDGAKVTAVEADGDGVTVRLSGTAVRAEAVVGADGANGISGRSLGLGQNIDHGVALEGNAHYGDISEERYRGRAVVELGTVPGGYTWIFPKGDHANVGAGGWGRAGPRMREYLNVMCARYGVPRDRLTDVRGHRLPMRRPGSRPARGRALLVGDAAGLVDPLSGDGMYEAFVSARLAAEAVFDLLAGRARDLEAYGRALDREVGRLGTASWAAKRAFDRFPRTTYAVAATPPVWRAFERLIVGEVPYPGAIRGPVRAPLRFIEGLSRLAA